MWEQHLKCIRYGETTDQRCANILNQMTFLSCSGYYIKDYVSLAVQYFSKGPVVKSRLLSKSNWKQILMREPIPGTIPLIKPMVHKCVTAITLQDWAKARYDSSAWHNKMIRLQADCVWIGMTKSPNISQNIQLPTVYELKQFICILKHEHIIPLNHKENHQDKYHQSISR